MSSYTILSVLHQPVCRITALDKTVYKQRSDILELVKDSELSSEERAVKLSIYHRVSSHISS